MSLRNIDENVRSLLSLRVYSYRQCAILHRVVLVDNRTNGNRSFTERPTNAQPGTPMSDFAVHTPFSTFVAEIEQDMQSACISVNAVTRTMI